MRRLLAFVQVLVKRQLAACVLHLLKRLAEGVTQPFLQLFFNPAATAAAAVGERSSESLVDAPQQGSIPLTEGDG